MNARSREVAGLLLIGLLISACERSGSKGPELLMANLVVAEKRWSGVLIEFGALRCRNCRSWEEGWSHGETSEEGRAFRWASEKMATFTFEADSAGRRIAWFTCQPFVYEGSPPQTLSLRR